MAAAVGEEIAGNVQLVKQKDSCVGSLVAARCKCCARDIRDQAVSLVKCICEDLSS